METTCVLSCRVSVTLDLVMTKEMAHTVFIKCTHHAFTVTLPLAHVKLFVVELCHALSTPAPVVRYTICQYIRPDGIDMSG